MISSLVLVGALSGMINVHLKSVRKFTIGAGNRDSEWIAKCSGLWYHIYWSWLTSSLTTMAQRHNGCIRISQPRTYWTYRGVWNTISRSCEPQGLWTIVQMLKADVPFLAIFKLATVFRPKSNSFGVEMTQLKFAFLMQNQSGFTS